MTSFQLPEIMGTAFPFSQPHCPPSKKARPHAPQSRRTLLCERRGRVRPNPRISFAPLRSCLELGVYRTLLHAGPHDADACLSVKKSITGKPKTGSLVKDRRPQLISCPCPFFLLSRPELASYGHASFLAGHTAGQGCLQQRNRWWHSGGVGFV